MTPAIARELAEIRQRWRAGQTKLADGASLREAWDDIEFLLDLLDKQGQGLTVRDVPPPEV